MSLMKYVLVLNWIWILQRTESSQFESIKNRLKTSAKSIVVNELLPLPSASTYLHVDSVPHLLNLTEQITQIIQQWSPDLLVADRTTPFYFSSTGEENSNLLAFLLSVQSNSTRMSPFLNVLPNSYRSALPLFSIYHCKERVETGENPFFHNIELLVGPGETELELEKISSEFSQLYCSLYGSSEFLLVYQQKESNEIFSDAEFAPVPLTMGQCVHVPPEWSRAAKFNNSISLIYTLKKLDEEVQSCTSINDTNLNTIDFTVKDRFNATDVGLMIYFHQYLKDSLFNNDLNAKRFLEHFQKDKNISQLIMKWTPEITKLIEIDLFEILDVNDDQIFNLFDYSALKSADLEKIQNSISDILDQVRQIVLKQYSELQVTLNKMNEQLNSLSSSFDTRALLENLIENLPENLKEKLREQNVDVKLLLDQLGEKKKRRKPQEKQSTRIDDSELLFDDVQHEPSMVNEEEEEEIIAEPSRTEL